MSTQNAKLNVLVSLRSAVQEGGQTLAFLRNFTSLLTTGAGAMAVFAVKQSAALGASLVHLAQKAQMTTGAFQTLVILAGDYGVKQEQVAQGAVFLKKNLQEAAANGASPMALALRDLGLSAAGLQALAPERQWVAIGRAIANASNENAAFNAGMKLLGEENGPRLMAMLKQLGSEGLEGVEKTMGALKISDEDLKRLERLDTVWHRISTRFNAWKSGHVADLLEAAELYVNNRNSYLIRFAETVLSQGPNPGTLIPIVASSAIRARAPENPPVRGDINEQRNEQLAMSNRNMPNLDEITMRRATEAAEAKAAAEARAKLEKDDRDSALRRRERAVKAQQELWARLQTTFAAVRAQVERDELETGRNLLLEQIRAGDEALRGYGDQLAKVESNPFLTDVEKRAERVRLLAAENAEIEKLIASLTRLSGVPGVDPAALQGQIRDLGDRRTTNTETIGTAAPLGTGDSVRAEITTLQDEIGTSAEMTARAFGSTIRSSIDTVAEGIQGLINGTYTWGDALRTIGGGILNGVVSAISRMFAEWIAKRALLAAKNILFSKAEGAADVAAKTPGALATAISSFGVAALVGAAAFAAVMAATGGFAGGGYTGAGPRMAPAGVVHRGEVVFESDIVRGQESEIMGLREALQMGIPAGALLSSIGHADGGAVGSTVYPVPSGPSGSGGGSAQGGAGKRERLVVLVDSARVAEQMRKDPNFDTTVVDAYARNRHRFGAA